MRRVLTLAGAIALGGLGACASVTRGTTSQVLIHSDPPGVEARLSTGLVCFTPCTLDMPRKTQFQVIFNVPGYEPRVVNVTTQVQGGGVAGVAGNAILGGLVGVTIDAATGAALDHCPNPVTVVLQPIKGPRRAEPQPIECAPAVDPNGPVNPKPE